VDDIPTNLKVAEGLLTPYGTTADTCLSGAEAIELVKQRGYDIVFMHHMMPEMDGIEATAVIRAWEKEQQKKTPLNQQISIIALTANAVVGMREMFIENGFNDFIAKPIDVSKLDEILNRWIPQEKREQGMGNRKQETGNRDYNSSDNSPVSGPQFPAIPGVDTAKGITMTGGTLAAYKQVLALFCKDIEERLPLLQKTPEEDTLSALVTHVHALKSASASIGAAEVSAQAAGLESVGKAGDVAFIRRNLPAFAQQLAELRNNIRAAIEFQGEGTPVSNQETDISACIPVLRELAEALKSQNASEIDRILDALNQKPLDSKTKEMVNKISDDVLMTEFDSALKTIGELSG
jgi:CheY-like chemotaxis protein